MTSRPIQDRKLLRAGDPSGEIINVNGVDYSCRRQRMPTDAGGVRMASDQFIAKRTWEASSRDADKVGNVEQPMAEAAIKIINKVRCISITGRAS